MSLLPLKFSLLRLPSKWWAVWRRPVVDGVLGVGTVWMGLVDADLWYSEMNP